MGQGQRVIFLESEAPKCGPLTTTVSRLLSPLLHYLVKSSKILSNISGIVCL